MKLSAANLAGQISSISQVLVKVMGNAQGFLGAVEGFAGDQSLTGEGYDSAKSYFTEKYQPLIRGLLLAVRSMSLANIQCEAHLAEVGGEDLVIDTDLLCDQISRLRQLVSFMESELNAANLIQSQWIIQSMNENIAKLESKIQKVYDFHNATGNLYDDAELCLSHVGSGLAEISSSCYYDKKSRTFHYPKNSSWSASLNEYWEQYQESLEDVDYQELNTWYWNRDDGYFDGLWWQDEKKLTEAIAMLEYEALCIGELDLLKLDMAYGAYDTNNRMFALQALVNAQREGSYTSGTITALEDNFTRDNRSYGDQKHKLSYQDIQYLKKQHDGILFKEGGYWLEQGWGDVIMGAAVLGSAVAVRGVQKYDAKKASSATEAGGVKTSGNGKYNVSKGPKIKDAKVKGAGGVDIVDDVANNITKANPDNAKVHTGQQDKHIPGTNNYNQEIAKGKYRSILSENPQQLLDDYAGTGQSIGTTKERVDFGKVIGKYYDEATGTYTETTKGIIHYNSKGKAHIIPARP